MRRSLSVAMALALAALGPSVGAQPASAATAWDVAGGQFTADDGFGATLAITVRNLQITNAGSASGYVSAAWDRYTCSTQTFAGTSASFFPSLYEPCSGSITFAVEPATGVVTASVALTMTSRLFTGGASGSAQGVAQSPVVVPLQNCASSTDVVGRGIDVTWTGNTDATAYLVSVDQAPGVSITTASGTSGGFDFAALAPGRSFTFRVAATRADGAVVATCTAGPSWTAPSAPVITSMVPVAAGGLLTVNYDLPDPSGVQGVEYQVDSGPWLRPGGVAPVNGTGGSFTLRGLSSKDMTVTLRTVGVSEGGSLTTEGVPASVSFPTAPTVKPTGSTTATGSTAAAPVSAPPIQPVASVPGTSNGAGVGTNGALAANTGDAGIDAPCLAPNGTLYPTLYSTVGSQLTMAPNTRGMGRAESFTVVGGALPEGIQLDRRYGVLFGVTTQAGSWTTTIRARFADDTTKDGRFGTRVEADAQALQYAAQNIGSVGHEISIAPSTNASTSGTRYTLVCGSLPNGTKLDAETGRILGRPTEAVSRPIPLRVAQSSSSGKAAASFIFVVDKTAMSHLSYPAHPHVRAGKRMWIRPTVSGVGDIAEFRTWKGKLPPGLELNRLTGVISGRVRHAGPTHTITIVAQTRGGALLTSAPMRLTLTR